MSSGHGALLSGIVVPVGLAANGALQTHVLHQPGHRAAGDIDALSPQLPPDLAHAVDPPVRFEHPPDLGAQLRVPLPAGYTSGSSVSFALAKLDPKASSLPTEDELRKLSELSNTEMEKPVRLEAELAADPVALAATRRRAVAVLKRVCEVLGGLRNGLSETVDAAITSARRKLVQAEEAERIAASASFADEPVANVGSQAWRILFEAARKFAAAGTESAPERLPETTGDLCLLCLEPLTSSGAARLTRFNDFVSGEATKGADAARKALRCP